MPIPIATLGGHRGRSQSTAALRVNPMGFFSRDNRPLNGIKLLTALKEARFFLNLFAENLSTVNVNLSQGAHFL